jgi:succinylglutamate desuccinylase
MNSSANPRRFLADTLAATEQAAPEQAASWQESGLNGVRLHLVDTGLLRVSPARPGAHRVLISCGVHGNETAPMEIVDSIVDDILTGKLAVQNECLFVIGNPPAAIAEERFIEENLNRLFSNKHATSGTLEATRAAIIERATEAFFSEGDEPRLHYDLHTAIRGSQIEKFAVYPYLHTRTWSAAQIGFLEHCGIEAVLFSSQPSGTYSYYTSHTFGADSFTVELGQVRRFGDNDMAKFTAIATGLRGLISGQELFQQVPESIKLFKVVEEVIKLTEAFQLHIPAEAKNFTEYPEGSLLASDEGYEYRTQQDGERFVFPITNVPPGQRAMLVVAPTQID